MNLLDATNQCVHYTNPEDKKDISFNSLDIGLYAQLVNEYHKDITERFKNVKDFLTEEEKTTLARKIFKKSYSIDEVKDFTISDNNGFAFVLFLGTRKTSPDITIDYIKSMKYSEELTKIVYQLQGYELIKTEEMDATEIKKV